MSSSMTGIHILLVIILACFMTCLHATIRTGSCPVTHKHTTYHVCICSSITRIHTILATNFSFMTCIQLYILHTETCINTAIITNFSSLHMYMYILQSYACTEFFSTACTHAENYYLNVI